MSWKKYLKVIKQQPNAPKLDNSSVATGTTAQNSNMLPEVYAGHPSRIQRYYSFQDMARDSDVHLALNTISDFCTQSEEQSDRPFEIVFNEEATEQEVKIVNMTLEKWIKLNDFRQKLFYIFNETITMGDSFFLRDPETGKWNWLDPFNVVLVKVDEDNGKEPAEYLIRGLNYNQEAQYATRKIDTTFMSNPLGMSIGGISAPGVSSSTGSNFNLAGTNNLDPRRHRHGQGFNVQDINVVDAKNIIHLSLSVGMDVNWPFGPSILEPVYKTYKQKELLEDSIIIYRVQRAPERRIFYIDVGSMPPQRAKAHIQAMKNELHQRRIPNFGAGGGMMDGTYNPLCISLDTQIPLFDGRTLTLEELIEEYKDGIENWVYSCDPETGKVVPGIISWAGITRYESDVMCITLNNGKEIICTPDHKFVTNKGFVRADKLTEDSLLMPFIQNYDEVFDNYHKKWISNKNIVKNFKNREISIINTNDGEKQVSIIDSNEGIKVFLIQEDIHVYEKSFLNKIKNYFIKKPIIIGDYQTIRSIEFLDKKMNVGTITVDGRERFHDYHTFAISSGIFIKNSLMDDFFIAQTAEGRGSKVDTLPGADNLGELGDVNYFLKKMARGLSIPTSYLNYGDENSQVSFNDGKLGAAVIQEYRFNKYCIRLQNLLTPKFDNDFKRYIRENGLNIDENSFYLRFNPPQNFSKYRQIELDSAQANVFNSLAENKFLSKRFVQERYLGLTTEEILKNEKLWREENPNKMKSATGSTSASSAENSGIGLNAVGIQSGEDDFTLPEPEGEMGDENTEENPSAEQPNNINNTVPPVSEEPQQGPLG